MSKQGIVMVSFGTSHFDTEEKTIEPITDQVAKLFNEFEVRQAFTSRMVINKLARKGRAVPNPQEAMEEMVRAGFTHVIVQPLLFLAGHEYEKNIVGPLLSFEKQLEGLVIGNSLIWDEEDYEAVVDLIDEIVSACHGETLILMGHGTDHSADRMYTRLQTKIDSRCMNAVIATVEGETTLGKIIPRLQEQNIKRVHLHPLMLVAGDHAKNDMAGDSEDSWKNILKNEGIEAALHLKGMGEYFPLRRIVMNHIRASQGRLFEERYRKMKKAGSSKKYPAPREEIPWYPRVAGDKCTGCGLCYLFCPKGVYMYDHTNHLAYVKNPYSCVVNCAKCSDLCPHNAINFPNEKIEFIKE